MLSAGSIAQAPERSNGPAEELLVLGPVIVARRAPGASSVGTIQQILSSRSAFVALHFPSDRRADGDDMVLVDSDATRATLAAPDRTTLLAPHRFLAGIFPLGQAPIGLSRSRGLRVLQHYLEGLLRLDRQQLDERQGMLAAAAIRGLLAAALTPVDASGGLGLRRRATLFERIVAHVDSHLRDTLCAESLCVALGCSRSALYRATSDAGGVAELVFHRRLIGVRELLRDPAERRSIADVARANGFADPSQFSRRFRAAFGTTPGAVRIGADGGGDGRRLADPSRH